MLQDAVDFCQSHKFKSLMYPSVESISIDQIWTEIILRFSFGHLPISGIDFPSQTILQEIRSLNFINHRADERQDRRNALVIFGSSTESLPPNPVNDVNQPIKTTSTWVNKNLAPFTTEYFQTTFPMNSYQHIVIMKLEPGGWIDPHTDTHENCKNINIALTLPKNSMACNAQGEIPYLIGQPMLFNTGIQHAIYNNGNDDRYMISVGGYDHNSELKKMIVKSYLEQRKRSLLACQ